MAYFEKPLWWDYHQHECFKYLGLKEEYIPVANWASKEVTSLSMNPFLTEEDVIFVAGESKEFN